MLKLARIQYEKTNQFCIITYASHVLETAGSVLARIYVRHDIKNFLLLMEAVHNDPHLVNTELMNYHFEPTALEI